MRHRSALLAAGLVAIAACGTPVPPPPTADSATERQTTSGRVVGFVDDAGNRVWLGIPYAAPPTGERRWRAPAAPERWAGVREALAFGPRCPQLASRLDSKAPPRTVLGAEDCLSLNIWAPADTGGAPLPVMVWIHGGGNVAGGSDFYDGAAFAAQQRVVLVSVNYRLGPLGWLRHASLREGAGFEEESGNFGTLDLIHALGWVRDNISAFGGDPDAVTIFGESAGARNVVSLLLAPGAYGLFHGAIAESGGTRSSGLDEAEAFVDAPTPGDADSSGELLLRLLEADGAGDREATKARLAAMSSRETADYLRGKSPTALLAAYEENGVGSGLYTLPQLFRDGIVLPKVEFLDAFATGDYARVPVILGSNRDEDKLFMFASPLYVRRFLGIPRLRDPEAYEREASYRSRFWKANGVDEPAALLRRLQGPSVFAYRFDWDEQPSILGADLGEMLGAAHFMEVPFVFAHWQLGPNTDLLFDEDNAPGREAVSHAMQSYWAEFAWTGRPGKGRGGDLPAWSPWDPSAPTADKYIVFDTPQDGGIRMAHEVQSNEALFAELARDTAYDEHARCALFAEWVRSVPRVAPRSGSLGCDVPAVASGE